ncbi:hypothetical protein [Streptosporangium sp. OZ121]|uniref:hypothetical protein n=1 Tax=Streptosporangium sp. OZ121 TaxID=3444183 RepID=UPI003F7AC1C1
MATVAAGSLFAGALPAQAANRDNCRGQVSGISTSGSAVVATYVVICNRVQNRIIVSADVNRHNIPMKTVRQTKTCNNTTRCSVHPRISNPKGRKLFSGDVLSGGLSLDALMTCISSDEFH